MKRNVNNAIAANNLIFDRVITYVYKRSEELLVRPMTDIQVYKDEPGNWHAVFGAFLNNEPVGYVIWQRDGIVGYEIRPAIRVRPNGYLEYEEGYTIDLKGEKNGRESLEEFKRKTG